MGWKEVAACLQEVLVLGEVDKGVCWREVVDQVGGYREEEESLRWGEVDEGMCWREVELEG